jgi:chemotaxis protein CheX
MDKKTINPINRPDDISNNKTLNINIDKTGVLNIISSALQKGINDTLEAFGILDAAQYSQGIVKENNEYRIEKGLFVMIGLIGDYPGRLVYRFPSITALNTACAMLGTSSDDMDDLDSIALSAISEFVNISSGSAVRNPEAALFEMDITPPTLISGEDMTVNIPAGAAFLFMDIKKIGKIDIFLSLV